MLRHIEERRLEVDGRKVYDFERLGLLRKLRHLCKGDVAVGQSEAVHDNGIGLLDCLGSLEHLASDAECDLRHSGV